MPRDDPITEEERRANSATDLIRMRLERLQQNIVKNEGKCILKQK